MLVALLTLVGFYAFWKSEDFKVLLEPCTEWSSVGPSACCPWVGFLGWEVGSIDLLGCQYSRNETIFYTFNPNFAFFWSSFSSSFLGRIMHGIQGNLTHHSGVGHLQIAQSLLLTFCMDFTVLFPPVELIFQSRETLAMTLSPPIPHHKMSFLLLTDSTNRYFCCQH